MSGVVSTGAPVFPTPRVALVLALLLLGPVGASGQEGAPEPNDFLAEVKRTADDFRDVEAAIAAGFRKLGPDFPGMGEHWVHPGRVISGEVDPARPPVLGYTKVGGEYRLVGVAFTRVLGPDEDVPDGPLPRAAWHDHTEAVDAEALLLSGPPSMHGGGSGFRLAMVHVWYPLDNPGGVFDQNNWALPFLRAGLEEPDAVSSEAGRALSLATSGFDFYLELFRVGGGLDGPALRTAERVLDRARADVRDRVGGAEPGHGATTPEPGASARALEEVWRDLWRVLRAELPAPDYARIAALGPGPK